MRRQNRPVGALIVLILALTAMAEAQESQNQVWANYDESGDLARLAELDDARMHYHYSAPACRPQAVCGPV